MRVKRPKLKIVAHYMVIDGKQTEIDPTKTNLPDRCKLAYAEMVTGKKLVLVEEGVRK
ncbi:hypothetical protein ERIC1_1c34870 [Paenibacillus larvae subsp. larvae DSM 25719]|uniref:hypothetical protein n=1 Tax=Paenibacillus larvae TaxID=1464 RepID=UPI0003DCE532|nr:hypothetical protein [Paenibacillus larvae]ETK29928.1 hypothetical protein ERIC1_1c34870 [Paenibacillus larvae subsp. larvae DSM 25719]